MPFGQHAHRRVVRIALARAGAGGVDRRVLGGQHELVQRALLGAEAAVGRKGARDVGGVAGIFAAGVDQAQLAGLEPGIAGGGVTGRIVEHAGVRAGGDDRRIGRSARAVAAEFVQQFGLDLVFVHRASAAAGRPRRTSASRVGAPPAEMSAARRIRAISSASLTSRSSASSGPRSRSTAGTAAPERARERSDGEPALDARLEAGLGAERPPDARAGRRADRAARHRARRSAVRDRRRAPPAPHRRRGAARPRSRVRDRSRAGTACCGRCCRAAARHRARRNRSGGGSRCRADKDARCRRCAGAAGRSG